MPMVLMSLTEIKQLFKNVIGIGNINMKLDTKYMIVARDRSTILEVMKMIPFTKIV
jgi:hypothetical protein